MIHGHGLNLEVERRFKDTLREDMPKKIEKKRRKKKEERRCATVDMIKNGNGLL